MSTVDSPVQPSATADGEARRRVAWRASALALFLPSMVIAAGYAGALVVLTAIGRGDGTVARVCLLVLVIGVPLLLTYAGLRLSTTQLTLRGAHLEAHPGFPVRDPVTVTYSDVTHAALRRGLSGWITGAGSLVIERESGAPVVVSGLAHPDAALADLQARRALLSKQD